MPTTDTPPPKSQVGNYIVLTIFSVLAALTWLGYAAMTWANWGAFHGTDFWIIHAITIAPAIFLTSCAYAIRGDIRQAKAANDDTDPKDVAS